MKSFSILSAMRAIGLLLVITLFVKCKKDVGRTNETQAPGGASMTRMATESSTQATLSQTRTANLFNQWGEPSRAVWASGDHQSVAADDGLYAYSKKLGGREVLSLQLHDFRFNIPAGATIESIVVTARRFKTGKGSIKDYIVHLITKRAPNSFMSLGPVMADANNYSSTETAVLYSQNGAGANGGTDGDLVYQWTPALVNDLLFGVRMFTTSPVAGPVVVYYDQVTITVNYW